jgi:hypothetical protein
MHLRAVVRKIIGKTAHLQGARTDGELEVGILPDPTTVEITEQEGAVFLLRLNRDGECIADTWHETIEAAKKQANFEFGIQNDDWENADIRH